MSAEINGNWAEVLEELDRRGSTRGHAGFLERVTAANARAAQAMLFGMPGDPVSSSLNVPRDSTRGGTVARAFWWGFHIQISHEDLQAFVKSADPVNALIGAIGGAIPSPAAPFIALAAAFVAGALQLLGSLDKGHGVYVSMSWFAPGVFVPTTV